MSKEEDFNGAIDAIKESWYGGRPSITGTWDPDRDNALAERLKEGMANNFEVDDSASDNAFISGATKSSSSVIESVSDFLTGLFK